MPALPSVLPSVDTKSSGRLWAMVVESRASSISMAVPVAAPSAPAGVSRGATTRIASRSPGWAEAGTARYTLLSR